MTGDSFTGSGTAPSGSAWVEVARVHDPARLGLVKSLLEAAGIDYVTVGEDVQNLFPVTTPGFFLDRGLGVVIRVPPEALDEARRALEEQQEV